MKKKIMPYENAVLENFNIFVSVIIDYFREIKIKWVYYRKS